VARRTPRKHRPRAITLALDGMCLLMENPIEEAFAKLKALC
jgi:hypothetical protein